jgi:hypothetical protein
MTGHARRHAAHRHAAHRLNEGYVISSFHFSREV